MVLMNNMKIDTSMNKSLLSVQHFMIEHIFNYSSYLTIGVNNE